MRTLFVILSTGAMPVRERLACLVDVAMHPRQPHTLAAWHSTALAWQADFFA